MKKKILITGSNGLLGQKLVLELLEIPEIEVIATSLGENRMPHTTGYVYEILDITKKEEVENAVKKHLPDTCDPGWSPR